MARTMVNDPLQRFRFRVEINGVEFGCRNVSGLELEIEVATYREGGYNATHKLPGIPSTGTLTIEKGVFRDINSYNLVKSALQDVNFRVPITIYELNRKGQPVRQWQLTEAWASKITAPEFDAESSEVSTEQLEIQYEELIPRVI